MLQTSKSSRALHEVESLRQCERNREVVQGGSDITKFADTIALVVSKLTYDSHSGRVEFQNTVPSINRLAVLTTDALSTSPFASMTAST